MGDSGEGLIDQDSRIQERMEELERERAKAQLRDVRDPERMRALESLRLARTELARQLASTTHERRRDSIGQAMAELDRRIAEANALGN
jgi:membrane protein involved in colicin uptake